MILLVDIGNSRIKWARLDGGKPADMGAVARGKTGIKRVLSKAWKEFDDVNRIVVANVGGPKVAEQLEQWLQTHWQIAPEFLTARSNGYGIRNAYSKPETLGIDRWLGLVAARQRYRGGDRKKAVCIVDCGSAITLDVLAADGKHLGGLIIPGLAMMPKLLTDHTAVINETTEEALEYSLLASTTGTAVSAGALYGAVAFIDRVSHDVAVEMKGEPKRVITGGDAPRVLPLLRDKYEHLPDLVLRGLARVAKDTSKVRRETGLDCVTQ
ncbi:type III pantothenate kinase [Nitrosococcus watsonii]|uniref:Type III pantothenate kinase n=1 Tax=Nitrosococcus watsoni (strain C-113) TaxID=105559 RepID=D8K8V3_NITWC|nr:type III pantothenate kinase [Nitrosococcus watsonii]ADJ27163.1 transcriptional activator, Baf family [Nitrosococcus watsonii C-113]